MVRINHNIVSSNLFSYLLIIIFLIINTLFRKKKLNVKINSCILHWIRAVETIEKTATIKKNPENKCYLMQSQYERAKLHIENVTERTAIEYFDYICPSILLIGEWDDHFESIKNQYQWAEFDPKVPNRLPNGLSLVVTNNRYIYNQVIASIDDTTAVLAYDESETIPAEKRQNKNTKLVCYLNSVSPRFITGHVRTLLQLKKWHLGEIDNAPLIITNGETLQKVDSIITSLDDGKPVDVITKQPRLFFNIFRHTVKMLHYKFTAFIESVEKFDDIANHDYTTLVLNVSSADEYEQYLKKPLMEYSIIFCVSETQSAQPEKRVYDLNKLGVTDEEYTLLAYYTCLHFNLNDTENRTRFIQAGDIKKISKKHWKYYEFIEAITRALEKNKLRFRNIAPGIKNLAYGNYPLNELIDQLDKKIYEEVIKQTQQNLDQAAILSGLSRSTIQGIIAKHSK